MPFDPNASFGKSLFFGEILEDQIFPYPEMPREQAELVEPIVETIDKYMASIDHRALDREGEMKPELLQSLPMRLSSVVWNICSSMCSLSSVPRDSLRTR